MNTKGGGKKTSYKTIKDFCGGPVVGNLPVNAWARV